jgi:general secretion pathway protein F
MTRYSFRALSPAGDVISGILDAADAVSCRRQIEGDNLILIEMTVVSSTADSAEVGLIDYLRRLTTAAPHPRNVIMFIQNLGAMLASRVRLDYALDLLTAPEMTGGLSGQVKAIRTSVMSGEPLSGALARYPDLFAPDMLALVAMAEQSGTLPSVLLSIAKERERGLRLKEKVTDALTYPAFLLTAAAFVLVFFIGFVLPQFSSVLTDMGAKADPTLLAILHISAYLGTHGREMTLISGVVLVLLLITLRTARQRATWVGVLIRLPVISSIDDEYRTAAFCRNFGNLIGYGVSLTEAIDLVGRSVARPSALPRWERAREEVRQGKRIFDALAGIDGLSGIALRMLRIGEETGEMSDLALRAADIFEARVERRIEKAIGIIGPAAIILVSLVIGGLIVSVMSALMSINQLVG